MLAWTLMKLPKWLLVSTIFLLLLWLLLPLTFVSATAGFGGYISEKLLGDGISKALYLGDGTNEMIVLGSGPVVSTLPAINVKMDGRGKATLRGNLSSLNGMPQVDVWFVWGYSVSSMPNTTAISTVFGTGEQTAVITDFNTKQDVYYQLYASADGISSGTIKSFSKADIGFSLLEIGLPITIALVLFIFVLATTGNPLVAFVGTLIGLLAFAIIQAMLQAISG